MCIKRSFVFLTVTFTLPQFVSIRFFSISPLDPIHTSSHRIVYLVAYGAVAGEVVNLVFVSASGDTSGGIRSIWASSEGVAPHTEPPWEL